MTNEPKETTSAARPEYLDRLFGRIDTLGVLGVGMVRDGFAAYRSGDIAAAREVVQRDDQLNELDVQIEQQAMRELAIRQPEAHDLRIVGSALKVASYLDRVGRQGYDCAWLAIERSQTTQGPLGAGDPAVAMLARMAERGSAMVEEAVRAFRVQDPIQARRVVELDDEIDALNRDVLARIVRPEAAEQEIGLRVRHALVARSLERVADNACKIAEKTVYSATGLRRTETDYLPHRRVPAPGSEPPP